MKNTKRNEILLATKEIVPITKGVVPISEGVVATSEEANLNPASIPSVTCERELPTWRKDFKELKVKVFFKNTNSFCQNLPIYRIID